MSPTQALLPASMDAALLGCRLRGLSEQHEHAFNVGWITLKSIDVYQDPLLSFSILRCMSVRVFITPLLYIRTLQTLLFLIVCPNNIYKFI